MLADVAQREDMRTGKQNQDQTACSEQGAGEGEGRTVFETPSSSSTTSYKVVTTADGQGGRWLFQRRLSKCLTHTYSKKLN